MKRSIFTFFILFLGCLCFGQTRSNFFNSKNIRGKYMGNKTFQDVANTNIWTRNHIKIKRGNNYKMRSFNFHFGGGMSMLEMSAGKWEIKNDTLILTEKFYKQNPSTYLFTFGKRIKNNKGQVRTQVTKFLHHQDKWYEISKNPYMYSALYTQYVRKGLGYKPFHSEYVDEL